MNISFKNKVVLVTGGTSGIGRVTAIALRNTRRLYRRIAESRWRANRAMNPQFIIP
jgi:NAD(P)-dependent dehydrogenase (short-subunit alcohol dehydrogenase family)